MNSPEFIQTSLAAAISLGLEHGSFKDNIRLTGLNLLLTYDEGCLGRCAYCGISATKPDLKKRGKKTHYRNGFAHKTFIRVKWPVFRLEDVLENLKSREKNFERICLSMVTHKNAVRDSMVMLKRIREVSGLPLSVLIAPSIIHTPETLEELKKTGAEMTGIAIDTATPELFEKYRGSRVRGPHKWQKYWEVLGWSVEVFGRYKTGIHLMIGLGETEEEAVRIIYDAYILGAKTHLFSFYPEPCSRLESKFPPELLTYRKIQIARYLINEKNLDISKISFDGQGRISCFEYDICSLLSEGGYAFMTSGCPCSSDARISACNRPFANERPSEIFRNYPYIPSDEDKILISNQISDLLPAGLRE